jgi:hypothetical protein
MIEPQSLQNRGGDALAQHGRSGPVLRHRNPAPKNEVPVEACKSRRLMQGFVYGSRRLGVYPLRDSARNILVGARTRLATPYGRGGPVQPLSRGECWLSSRVYIGSTPTSRGTNFSTKGRRIDGLLEREG